MILIRVIAFGGSDRRCAPGEIRYEANGETEFGKICAKSFMTLTQIIDGVFCGIIPFVQCDMYKLKG